MKMPVSAESRSRIGLAIFFVLVLASSAFLLLNATFLKNIAGTHAISAYMWCVAAASLVARLILRESPRDVSFRWNGWATTRAMLIALAFPLIVGAASYGIAWSIGLASFTAAALPHEANGLLIAGSVTGKFCKYLLISLTIGALGSCKSATGEELGWRGYMLTRLTKSGVPKPILFSGLIWALWHVPLIISGLYDAVPHTISSITIFLVDITAMGYIFAWLRISSGSIWPCILAHGVWNAVILGPFSGSTHGGEAWVGEAGVLTTFMVVAISVALYRVFPLQMADYALDKNSSVLEVA
jgi:membrane protease YdiL (CAAX protease family)